MTKPWGAWPPAPAEDALEEDAVGSRLSVVEPVTATWDPSPETARPKPEAPEGAPRVRVKTTLPAESYLIRATSLEPLIDWPFTSPATSAST